MNHLSGKTLLGKPFWLPILLLVVLAGAASPAVAREPNDRPNILFIMVDDLGKEWVSCYGAEEIETPHVDALGCRGDEVQQCLFDAAMHADAGDVVDRPVSVGAPDWCNHWDVPRWGAGCHFDWKHNVSFARPMKEAGYATAAAGKWQINDFRVSPDAMRQARLRRMVHVDRF